MRFLSGRPALKNRPSDDLGAGNEAAGRTKRAARKFFGRDDHAEVVWMSLVLKSTEALGDRKAEAAEVPQMAADFFGYEQLLAMNFFCEWRNDRIRELAQRVADHDVTVVQSSLGNA